MFELRALLWRLGLSVSAVATLSFADIAAARAEPTRAGTVTFDVLRGGRPFGTQSVTVTQTDGGMVAETRADLSANLGPVNVFRYRQTCREVWREAQLQSLNCTTTKSGLRQDVSANLGNGALRVTGAGAQQSVPAETRPTTWWTRPRLGSYVLINTETGASLPVRVIRIGRERINAGGQEIMADRIRVQGTVSLDLWYDESGSWVSCAFTISGQNITYRLASPLGSGPA